MYFYCVIWLCVLVILKHKLYSSRYLISNLGGEWNKYRFLKPDYLLPHVLLNDFIIPRFTFPHNRYYNFSQHYFKNVILVTKIRHNHALKVKFTSFLQLYPCLQFIFCCFLICFLYFFYFTSWYTKTFSCRDKNSLICYFCYVITVY